MREPKVDFTNTEPFFDLGALHLAARSNILRAVIVATAVLVAPAVLRTTPASEVPSHTVPSDYELSVLYGG